MEQIQKDYKEKIEKDYENKLILEAQVLSASERMDELQNAKNLNKLYLTKLNEMQQKLNNRILYVSTCEQAISILKNKLEQAEGLLKVLSDADPNLGEKIDNHLCKWERKNKIK